MTSGQSNDAVLLRTLCEVPQYRRWLNKPLDDRLMRQLTNADSQPLMSVAAHALKLLTQREH